MNTLPWTLPTAPTRRAALAAELTLLPGATHTLTRCAGARIEVTSGRLWLTEPGDLDDHFLARGASHRLVGDGPVVIESDGPGAATLRILR